MHSTEKSMVAQDDLQFTPLGEASPAEAALVWATPGQGRRPCWSVCQHDILDSTNEGRNPDTWFTAWSR